MSQGRQLCRDTARSARHRRALGAGRAAAGRAGSGRAGRAAGARGTEGRRRGVRGAAGARDIARGTRLWTPPRRACAQARRAG